MHEYIYLLKIQGKLIERNTVGPCTTSRSSWENTIPSWVGSIQLFHFHRHIQKQKFCFVFSINDTLFYNLVFHFILLL